MTCSGVPIPPDETSVRAACEKFDKEDAHQTEQALQELFNQYRTNGDKPHVLLKVVALNRLYSAGIFDVHGMADRIHQQAGTIDAALAQGSPRIVDEIARFLLDKTGRKFYAFASKYCSWHNPGAYPIWDSNVCRYLSCLKDTPFAKPDYWERYAQFVSLMAHFREHYKLDAFGFKEIDKFLWIYGAEPNNGETGDAASA